MALWKIESTGALTLANSFTYGTWGEPTTATHNSIGDLEFRFLYVGAADVQWDADLGLHYMHARHYSPDLGRFLQPDPSRLDAQLFAYAEGNPVTKVDPSGLKPGPWHRVRQEFINQKLSDAIFLGFPLRSICSVFGVAGSLCWVASVGINSYSGQSTWLVRESWYSTNGYAKVKYRGAVKDSRGWLFLRGYYEVKYSCNHNATQALRCAEVLAGYRSPYNLDWYCGSPISIIYVR